MTQPESSSSPRPIRALIVDDEPLARRRLRKLLDGRPGLEVLAEYGDGQSAVRAITEGRPDLVFLDIQMPELDGFGVVEAVGPDRMPATVFVTAYDAYALDAFAVSALDYLLKPFADERFEQALERALERLHERRSAELTERLACLLEGHRINLGQADVPNSHAAPVTPTPDTPTPSTSLAPAPGALRRLAVQHRGRIYFVPLADVDWIAAEGSYVRLHTGERSHLVRDSLKRLEGVLDPQRFVRIHRSAIVNAERVVELEPLFHGEHAVRLASGAELKLSRSYRASLERLLGCDG